MAAVKRAITTINKRELLELGDDELALLARRIGILPQLGLVSKRFHDLFAPRLQTLKPLASAPFCIPFNSMDGSSVFIKLKRLHKGINDDDMSAFSCAVSKGALDKLTVRLRPTALSPCLQTWQVRSPD